MAGRRGSGSPPTRLEVGHRCLRASDRFPRLEGGNVDLAPHVGRLVHIAPKGVRALLRCDLPTVLRLIDAGLLVEDTAAAGRLKRYVVVDPGVTFASMYLDWLDRFPPPRTYADWQRYKDVRLLCRISPDEPHPDGIMRAALDFLVEMGTINRHELRGILPCSEDSEKRIVKWMLRELRIHRRDRAWSDEAPPDIDLFRLLLPPEIARAPETCFDQVLGDAYPAPPPKILARLARLGPLFHEGTLFMLRLAGRSRTPMILVGHMRHMERLDGLLTVADPAVGPRTPEAVARSLDAYALTRTLAPDDVDGVRLLVAQEWHAVHDDLKDYVARVARDDAELGEALARHVPPAHPRRSDFEAGLQAAYGSLREEGRRKRKSFSDVIADDRSAVTEALRLRMVQLSGLADAGRCAAAELRTGTEPYVDFGLEGPVLLPDGSVDEGMQTMHMRCWRATALHAHLARDAGGSVMVKRRPGRPRSGEERVGPSLRDLRPSLRKRLRSAEPDGDGLDPPCVDGKDVRPDVFFEYVGTTLSDPAQLGRSCEPWFVTLLRRGTLVRPAYLSVAMRNERRELMLEWRLPGYQPTRGGLLGFNRAGSSVFRAAADHHAPLCIVPLIEFDHAMRLAHLDFKVQLETSCRVGEALQIASPRSDLWEQVPDAEEEIWAFKAIPKQSKGSVHPHEVTDPYIRCPVGDSTLELVCQLEELLIARCHPGGAVPSMPIHSSYAWKCDPQPYLFSYGGTALGCADLNTYFRYLAAGIVRLRSHDLRHVSANVRMQSGATDEELGADLNTTPKIARRYGRPTERQASAGRVGLIKLLQRDGRLRGRSEGGA